MIEIIHPVQRDEETGVLIDHAVGRCSCGQEVYLDGPTNDCVCGKSYNLFGQELQEESSDEEGSFYDGNCCGAPDCPTCGG